MSFAIALQELKTGNITFENIQTVLLADQHTASQLFALAQEIRFAIMGKKVFLRGLIEFSNYCRNSCAYCGLNINVKNQIRYRLNLSEILECAAIAQDLGYQTLVLQAGEDAYYTPEKFTSIISTLKDKYPTIALTLSFGLHSKADYQTWFKAGADRYLMRFETSNAQLFAQHRPGTNLQERLTALSDLQEIGYQVGTGNLIGLPGQTLTDLVNDILLLYKLQPDMIGVGPFIPHPATLLANEPAGDVFLALKELAILRIILPYVHLPATTAFGTLKESGQLLALNAGANVIMPNVSPETSRKLYAIYPNKAGSLENSTQTHARILNTISKAKLEADFSRGDSYKL